MAAVGKCPACRAAIPLAGVVAGGEVTSPTCGKRLRINPQPASKTVPRPVAVGPARTRLPPPAQKSPAVVGVKGGQRPDAGRDAEEIVEAEALPEDGDGAEARETPRQKRKKKKKKPQATAGLLGRVSPRLLIGGGAGLGLVVLLLV